MNNLLKSNRIESIDLLRGIVMIIMALDHVRDYFHADAYLFNPLNLDKTNAAIFATRWVTHFCAPVFVFLAGTSAYLVGKRKGKGELSKFLFTRGLWLIVLELTVVNFSWFFNIQFSMIALTVIWALGVCMIILAAAIHLPYKFIFALGILFVAGHNLLDAVHVQGEELDAIGWALLHEFHAFDLAGTTLFVGYGLIPWTGVMFLGYCFGWLYRPSTDAAFRKKILLYLGSGTIILFIVGRLINVYGDPVPWTTQATPMLTFLSFMNVAKYPPSIFYILITLGPAFLFLAFTEKIKGWISQNVISLGRVPMFYYVTHIYLIHVIALFAAVATGYHASDMVFTSTWVTDSPNLVGYGFGLGVTYLVWIAVVLALFPLCKWYDGYKTRHKEKWWLSYL
jgi:uncharacterized membrane protein